jgi:hypothetical protein
MSSVNTTPIIAGGEWRVLCAARADAARVRARLTRRAQPLLHRANLVGCLVIRYRIFRFVCRYIAKRAPAGTLYAAKILYPTSSGRASLDVPDAANALRLTRR